MLKMDLEYNQGILFVRLKGILNNEYSYKINNYLNPVIEKHKIKYLVYNLYSLEDIDSSGLSAIKKTEEKIKENDGIICLCEVNTFLNNKLKKLNIKKIATERSAFLEIEV